MIGQKVVKITLSENQGKGHCVVEDARAFLDLGVDKGVLQREPRKSDQ